MNREKRRSLVKRQKEHLKQLNLPKELTALPKDKWPADDDITRIDTFVSQKYMVQVFMELSGVVRLSINRTRSNGISWEENLTWEELQDIKNQVGFEECDAVEVYPRQSDVVNVANMRHLFIVPELLKFAWRKNNNDYILKTLKNI